MANTTSVKGSAAAKAVGTVKNIIGSATATDASGVTRTLHVGDKVYANEIIKTSEAGAILIEFANGNTANLGRDSSMTLTGDIFGIQSALAPAGAEKMSAAQKAAVQDVQAKIAAGLDPTQVTEAAAAGPNAAGSATEGSGYNFVVVNQLAARGEVTSGFPTGPISVVLEQPPAELGYVEPEEVVPAISIAVGVDVSVGIGVGSPGEGGITIIPGDAVVPAAGVTAINIPEGSSPGGTGTHPVTFLITLDQVAATDVTITYTINPGSASSPGDFSGAAITGTVTIPAGSKGFTVTEFIVEDNLVEGNESFYHRSQQSCRSDADQQYGNGNHRR